MGSNEQTDKHVLFLCLWRATIHRRMIAFSEPIGLRLCKEYASVISLIKASFDFKVTANMFMSYVRGTSSSIFRCVPRQPFLPKAPLIHIASIGDSGSDMDFTQWEQFSSSTIESTHCYDYF